MKILFLDQSGKLGGAELSLIDVAQPYRETCLVCLFSDGHFRELLEEKNIPVEVIATQPIKVSKESGIIESLKGFTSLFPLIVKIANIAANYDLIYANTQKALVVSAFASFFSRRPLVYHLRDILSPDHFSRTNRQVAVTLANQFASLVIANSQATQNAFIAAGGRKKITEFVYNGFNPEKYIASQDKITQIRQELGLNNKFIVGHFSRISPWKGQDILLEAIAKCPSDVTAIFVGDALFGEDDYVAYLHQQVDALNLQDRVKFLGFRSDIVPLMSACNLIAHTSTAPEPFGRVIVEAMLCGTPIVAAAAGGAIELVENEKTGWLFSPGNSQQLADIIMTCRDRKEQAKLIANRALIQARQRFDLNVTNQQIARLLAKCQLV
ncbi:MAG TPA: glycosyltransferase family 1 protein [Cyanobacteria bacterium UBA11149]|nr:glycosyltransferase family 1 protein [Cyanobacteria bacterium UBA11367]HBE56165.1 glycosyltransferase family 1 protein [Cyanobacteria bacterium UBA11366]HBK62186.1 glycosyltransferase family 1 protein [Cyanobacteria bacterium UBA11166]HBR73905.1 glycosyltransferase family 1 protein [Cyanobacteria bacterium UBA11159]HBS70210.1 glycosyltransferase family 1 protein [Cyanobacteria bacterium UBA11153]HBW90843.1 glycosyltransferase family 1 protein [Cyanobacteria bacterium UBA11149]HCA96337.1 gl